MPTLCLPCAQHWPLWMPALPVPTPTTGTQCPILWAAWVRAVSRQGEVGRAKLAIMRALWKQDSPPNQGVKAVTGFYT